MLGLCCCTGFSLVAANRDYSLFSVSGLLCSGFSCCRTWASGNSGFSSCSTGLSSLRFPGSRAQAQLLRHMDLVAPRLVGSSRIREPMSPALAGGFFTIEPPGKLNNLDL